MKGGQEMAIHRIAVASKDTGDVFTIINLEISVSVPNLSALYDVFADPATTRIVEQMPEGPFKEVMYNNAVIDPEQDTIIALCLYNGPIIPGTIMYPIDSYTYTMYAPEEKSFARIPDGSPNWIDPIPTPGYPNILGDEEIASEFLAEGPKREDSLGSYFTEPLLIEATVTEELIEEPAIIEEVIGEHSDVELILEEQPTEEKSIEEELFTAVEEGINELKEDTASTTDEVTSEEELKEEEPIEEGEKEETAIKDNSFVKEEPIGDATNTPETVE